MRRSFQRLFCSKAIASIGTTRVEATIGIDTMIAISRIMRIDSRNREEANKLVDFHSDKVRNGFTYVYKTRVKNPTNQKNRLNVHSEVEVTNVDKYKDLIDNGLGDFASVPHEYVSSEVYYEMNKKISAHLAETIDDFRSSEEDRISYQIFTEENKRKIRAEVNKKIKKYGLRVNSIKTFRDPNNHNKNNLSTIVKQCTKCG